MGRAMGRRHFGLCGRRGFVLDSSILIRIVNCDAGNLVWELFFSDVFCRFVLIGLGVPSTFSLQISQRFMGGGDQHLPTKMTQKSEALFHAVEGMCR